MLGNIVLIRHPKVPIGPSRALHFTWQGRPYYATPNNIGIGRTAWGYMDGVTVVERYEQVTIPQQVVEDIVAYVDSILNYETRAYRFLTDNGRWFRNPDPVPTMPVTPSTEETQQTLAGCGFDLPD